MALAICNTITDESGRELLEHGTAAFPIACYCDDLNEAVPWHWHDEWELILITEGSAAVTAGADKQTLQAGEGFFVNSGVLHEMRNAGTSVCRFHSLVLHPRLVGGSIDSVFYQSYVRPLSESHAPESVLLRPSVPWQHTALEAMEAAWHHCVSEPPGYEFRVRSALSELLFLIWEHTPRLLQQPSAKALRDEERTKTMLQYIHQHYGDEITTEQIAASALISGSECLRCFHRTIGTTPIQYVKQYRIQRAAYLLATTQDKVADIGAHCGFQDLSYFTKTFRQLKGCVPTEYRKAK